MTISKCACASSNDFTACVRLNGWCYWTLRKEGFDVQDATGQLRCKPAAELHEMLFHGQDYDRFILARMEPSG